MDEKAVVCNALNLSSSIASIVACKVLGLKVTGIVTDVPTYSFNKNVSLIDRINFSILRWFDNYVFITEQMNSVINSKGRPYIVMEAVIEKEDNTTNCNSSLEKDSKRVILYAGGLNSMNGTDLLLSSFQLLKKPNVSLHLYGYGPMVEDINRLCAKDSRIKYFGIRPTKEVMMAEKRASLLVNPRDTQNPCVPYSFPIKNMEFMSSGTPLLTTKLCCIPQDHYEHLFFFPDERTADSYATTIENVLSLSPETLNEKGRRARSFVLEQKNNIVQVSRILKMIFKN